MNELRRKAIGLLARREHSRAELARKLGVSRKCLWERRQRLGIPRSKGKSISEGI